MPKTSEEIAKIRNSRFTILGDKKDYAFVKKLWFSEQELKDKLKKAENRIDAITMKQILELALNKPKESALKILVKQILNDCFGVGK